MANVITACRLLAGIALLFTPVFSKAFYGVYLFGGFTDMIDGTVARKTEKVSDFGAKLDTAADTVFCAAALWKIFPEVHFGKWVWIWIGIIAGVKVFNVIWSLAKEKKLPAIHTIANKLVGGMIFLFPLVIRIVDISWCAGGLCLLATFAAVEEGHLIRGGKSIFH